MPPESINYHKFTVLSDVYMFGINFFILLKLIKEIYRRLHMGNFNVWHKTVAGC